MVKRIWEVPFKSERIEEKEHLLHMRFTEGKIIILFLSDNLINKKNRLMLGITSNNRASLTFQIIKALSKNTIN